MAEIDDLILRMGKLIAHEFTTKPVEVALDTTRMLRAQLHETEKFKIEYELKMLELTPFVHFPLRGFGSSELKKEDFITTVWPFEGSPPFGWNRVTNEERQLMINRYGLDDPILDPDKMSDEQVHEMLREMGEDPVELGERGRKFVEDLLKKRKGA